MQQKNHRLVFSFARSQSEILEAQRLRYKVYADEMGAFLTSNNGFDQDGFDAFCDHLIVRDCYDGKVVATYRLLDPDMSKEAGGYYAAGEFDLSRLSHLFDNTVEIGRACVHRDYRHDGTIAMLWAGLAQYMQMYRYQHMIGSVSMSMADGGHLAASLFKKLQPDYLAPAEYHVFPHCPLPLHALKLDMQVACPSLIKGYLRLGAFIGGEPAWDPHFNTANMPIFLSLTHMNRRYAALNYNN
ncbi:MAG: GNAT family N-acyltransferase [Methylophilaceae bacterium]